jgi:hypothetical protein
MKSKPWRPKEDVDQITIEIDRRVLNMIPFDLISVAMDYAQVTDDLSEITTALPSHP